MIAVIKFSEAVDCCVCMGIIKAIFLKEAAAMCAFRRAERMCMHAFL